MRLVTYGLDDWYLLTDDQFRNVAKAWAEGKDAFLESRDLWLPRARSGAGTMPEHEGLNVGWSDGNGRGTEWPLPGWIAYKENPFKVFLHQTFMGRSEWYPPDLTDPSDGSCYSNQDPALAKEFLEMVGFIPVDKCLLDPNLRGRLPWHELLPDRFQKKN